MYVESVPDGAEFDFVVVGAGSAGCVLANRLSADPAHRVLLVEAGGRDNHIEIRVPVLVAKVLNDERLTWPYVTEPQAHLGGRTQKWARGRVIGGSSSINGGVFVRGDPLEYDHWRDTLGCTGWGYADLLPVFKRLEHCPWGDPAVRGRGGPISCTRLDRFDALAEGYLAALGEHGIPVRDDYNAGQYEGGGYIQMATRAGLRDSAAVGYLHPIARRRNLAVLPRATVARVLLDGRRATGVELVVAGSTRRVVARREVILSAGPMGSPQLLELSGIGAPQVLGGVGVPVAHALPAVGENLRDHPNTRISYECTQPITINDMLRSPWRKFREGARFLLTRRGMMAISSSTVQAHVRSRPEEPQPDMTLRLHPLSGKDRYSRTPEHGLDPWSGFTIGVTLLRPRSVGALHIRSRDPLEHPVMDPRYLSHEADAQRFLDGLRIVRALARQPSLARFIVRETRPGPGMVDDGELMDYVRSTVQTAWHQVGTCRMGTGDEAVVDPRLRVRGIERLRVVDSSVFPTIPAANTNIPSIACGEKGADLILEDARA